MNNIEFDNICTTLSINRCFVNELRDKLLDNMNLDDVNIETVSAYINKCSIDRLLEINSIAEALDDWQLVGRIIGNAVEQFKIKG